MERILFTTFADGNFGLRAAGKRLIRQARASGLFVLGTKHQDLKSLETESPSFMRRNSSFIHSETKGLGNYLWKPQVILNVLKDVAFGDLILYLDSGCQLNFSAQSLLRFNDYVEMAKSSGAMFMQLKNGAFGASSLSDEAWTKDITLDLLDPMSTYRKSPQIQSGIILMKKTQGNIEFVESWLHLCESHDYKYLKTPENQNEVLLGHRWEQSILSLLIKSSTNFALVSDETYWAPDWSTGEEFPIWAMRNRSGGDAFRRNFSDLFQIALAKISRI